MMRGDGPREGSPSQVACRRSWGPVLVAAGLVAMGCGGQTSQGDDGGASVSDASGAAEGAGGTGGTGGANQLGVGAGGNEESCPAETLPPLPSADVTYTTERAPEPQGGALPSSGLFDLVAVIHYGQHDGLHRASRDIVRFRPNNQMDRANNTFKWFVDDETSLRMVYVCPRDSGGKIEPYTFADDELTLYTPNGVYVYRRRDE